MVISSEVLYNSKKRSETIPGREVHSSEWKCQLPYLYIKEGKDIVQSI